MKYETWKPVVGFESLYEVSDHGRVRSVNRVDSQGRNLKGRVLKERANSQGYKLVCLSSKGAHTNARVHVLVAQAFVAGQLIGAQVLHRDDVPHHNIALNLRWGTAKDNGADRVANGRSATGERNGRSKLTSDQVAEIKRRLAGGAVRNHLRKEFGVSFQTIERIASGESWRSACAIC